MKISKELITPVTPPPVEYHLVLTEEEYQVIKAAIAVSKFNQVRESLTRCHTNPEIVVNTEELLCQMHKTLQAGCY